MKFPHVTSHSILRFFKQITILNLLLLNLNLTVFFNSGNIFLQVVTFSTLIMIPGFLLTKAFALQGSFIQRCVYSVPFGIAFLTLTGILINTVLPIYSIAQPLGVLPFFAAYNILTILLFTITLLLKRSFVESRTPPQIHIPTALFSAIATAFPFLTLFGTIHLNNGGSNLLVLAGLLGIALYLLAVVLFRKHLRDSVFSYSLFIMALALLLMYSARNPFLMGWDIQNEVRVFQKTLSAYYWNPFSKGDIYNATLGVTILPTIFTHIFTIKTIYIFKYIYPVIFAFSSLAVFYLLRQYLSRIAAYLGTFFCICQLSYVSMPSLARQEIGFLMFSFMMLFLFDKVHSKLVKNMALLFLGIVMVITHYSTTYVALLLLIFTFFLGLGLRVVYHFFPKIRIPKATFSINIGVVLILTVLTLFWYGLYTQATENVDNFFTAIKRNILKTHTEEGKAQQSWITITGSNREATPEDLQKYIAGVIRQYRFDETNLSFFDMDLAKSYPLRLEPVETIEGDPVLKVVSNKAVLYIRQFIKILLVIGLLVIGWLVIVRKKLFVPVELLISGYVYQLFIAAAIFVPAVSAQYNIERLYQQGLIILVFFLVGVIQLLKTKFTTLKYFVLSIIFIIYFFSHHGVIIQFTGGEPLVNLNNYGDDYGQYYIHTSEITTARWYFTNRNPKLTLYADTHATLRFASQGRVDNIISALVPPVIFKNGYVFASDKNLRSGYVQANINGIKINYTFQEDFFNENKNLIYSNDTSRLYQ